MYTLIIKNEQEYRALIRALETAQDIADDTSTEPVWPLSDVQNITLTRDEMMAMKNDVDERIDNLVSITKLLERAECLKS